MNEQIDGVTYFKVMDNEEKRNVFVSIGKCLNVCAKCPVSTVKGSTYCTIEEREELCGGCDTYKEMRSLADTLPSYDLTTRHRKLLNKGADEITAEELEELIYSGVQKAVIARAMGVHRANGSKFVAFLYEKGVNIPSGYKVSEDEQNEYQTKSLGAWD